MTDAVLAHLERGKQEALDRLRAWLAIPSVSTDPAYAASVRQAADWAVKRLASLGMTANLVATPGHPIVLAATPPGTYPASAPHVIFYGHYDVQPPDPLEQWRTPPFDPQIRDGAIYARGASDDKGQVSCFLEALAAWRHVHQRWPVRVTLVLEGEEECGSTHLKQFIAEQGTLLDADPTHGFVLISDTTMWNPRTVAITYGLRGLLYYDVQLHGPSRDLHSGVYGGAMANPATMLARVLGRLFDEQHRVTIPGFYDDVLPVSPAEKTQWNALQFDEMRDCLTPIGVSTPYGEAGFSTLERKWVRPACDINGLYGGYGGPGAKTVIPSFAGAKVSFRLAPNQDPKRIATAFEQWLHGQSVHGCRWKLTHHGDALPVVLNVDSPWIAAATRAVRTTTGAAPALIRTGATIPVIGEFKRCLGLDSLLVGFALADDAIHSPNEKFNVDCFHLGCRTHAALLAELAQPS
ncbi:MAG: M20/M25/M40 family metallo-hydrolase [Phycisphaeraceae bacterium]|nr:M20/M25/M40 family metallo-hydrolase [Phycisphaeraceae bacterium]